MHIISRKIRLTDDAGMIITSPLLNILSKYYKGYETHRIEFLLAEQKIMFMSIISNGYLGR